MVEWSKATLCKSVQSWVRIPLHAQRLLGVSILENFIFPNDYEYDKESSLGAGQIEGYAERSAFWWFESTLSY